jgi:membrane protein implicated in regulation of membrane protease activity
VILIFILGLIILSISSFDTKAQDDNDTDDDGSVSDSTYPFALALIFIGVMILLAEPFVPGLFLAIPGTVLVSIGAVGLIAPEYMYTPVALLVGVITGTVAFLVAMKTYRVLSPNKPPTTTVADSLIGKEGIVTAPTDPDHRTKGKVRIESQIWSAYADTVIPVGEKVKVIASEGVHVKVKRIPGKRRTVKRSIVDDDNNDV